MPKLSVTIVAQDEEADIGECVASVAWADEVIVVDGGSRDRTVEIAERAGARVIRQPWTGYAAQKNFALDRATHDWVLSVDADERVTTELRAEVMAALDRGPEYDGYQVPRRSYFLGQWMRHGGWYPDYNLRLFRRGKGRFREREVHERVDVDGRVGALHAPIDHYTYRTLSEYVQRMDRYSTLAAHELRRAGVSVGPVDLLVRPAATFVRMYVVQRGFLDGFRGLLLAGCYASYTFFKYAKAWEAARASKGSA
jgi:glycosyltransferase involved in cell wall biosynthesis